MIVGDLLDSSIIPFEIGDDRMMKLYSFFLHLAPNIESKVAMHISENDLKKLWSCFLTEVGITKKDYYFYSPGYISEMQLDNYKLNCNDEINRKTKRLICNYKEGEHDELTRLLRHIRNSIAHGNTFCYKGGNRKYLLFDDYNKNKHLTARILFAETDLIKLKRLINNKARTQ